MMRKLKLLAALTFAILLAACGEPSKGDLIDKAAAATTKAELRQALGKPTSVDKIGPVEKWTYKASDGTVIFVITGDIVAMQATSGSNTNN